MKRMEKTEPVNPEPRYKVVSKATKAILWVGTKESCEWYCKKLFTGKFDIVKAE